MEAVPEYPVAMAVSISPTEWHWGSVPPNHPFSWRDVYEWNGELVLITPEMVKVQDADSRRWGRMRRPYQRHYNEHWRWEW